MATSWGGPGSGTESSRGQPLSPSNVSSTSEDALKTSLSASIVQAAAFVQNARTALRKTDTEIEPRRAAFARTSGRVADLEIDDRSRRTFPGRQITGHLHASRAMGIAPIWPLPDSPALLGDQHVLGIAPSVECDRRAVHVRHPRNRHRIVR